MRQSNQKSRSRGRSRKPQNSMSRNFESNGPDVKIRGNAAHIAEKYTTLARDCLSNGDRVIAENYLQHAEHYNRIVAAAQQQSDARAAEQQARNPQPDVEDAASEDDNGQTEDTAEANTIEANANDDRDSVSKVESMPETEASASESEVDEAPKERKTTRTRRPRKQPIAADAEKPEAASDEPAVEVEIISDDASKLPGSLLGGMVAEEG